MHSHVYAVVKRFKKKARIQGWHGLSAIFVHLIKIQTMKKINLLLMALGSMVVLSLASCDPCSDVDCGDNGTCVEGDCECDEGFSGDACEIEDLCVTQDVECLNGGSCDDGVCTCVTGYEGDDCGTEMRAKFIATFSVTEVCGSGSDAYTSDITASSADVSNVLISNVYNTFTNNVVATVDGMTLTIASQTPDNDGISIDGTGSISDAGVVTITFNLSDGLGNSDACTATYTKQ